MYRQTTSWKTLRNHIVDYTWDDSFNRFFREHRSVAITGPPGVGKSTFLLWLLFSALEQRIDTWFERAVFLDAGTDLEPDPALRHVDPNNTVLVIDSLFRTKDSQKERQIKSRLACRYTQHQFADVAVGPFAVIMTLRDDEYDQFSRWVPDHGFLQFSVDTNQLDLWQIFRKRLNAHGVRCAEPADRSAVVARIREMSLGVPIYLEYLARQMAEQGTTTFNPAALEQFPAGMTNLVWQILMRLCSRDTKSNEVTLFLLRLLAESGTPLSETFFTRTVEILSAHEVARAAKGQIRLLRDHYLAPQVPKLADGTLAYGLNSHWQAALEESRNNSQSVRTEYRTLVDEYRELQFDSLKDRVLEELYCAFRLSVKSSTDATICSDLVNLGFQKARAATRLWLSKPVFPRSKHLQADQVLFNAWMSQALHHKHIGNPKLARHAFDCAFRLSARLEHALRVEQEKRALHSYIRFLRRSVLPTRPERTYPLFHRKIEELYQRMIDLDPADKMSWQSKAVFYQGEERYQGAVDCFESALKLHSADALADLPVVQAYGICLRSWGDHLWMQDSDRAGELYEKAHERFKRGREAIDEIWSNADLLQRVRAAGRIRELEANESMLLNAYAITCLEEATKADDRNERIIFDRQADNLFRSALQKYPDDAHTINKYADFLLKYAWLLPEYQIPRRRNVLEAKNLLRGAMDRARVAGQQTDAITQHTLARLYIYYERPPNFAEAESLLKKSAASSDPWQQAISWLELAKLYIRRAREQGDVSSSQSYFTLAGGATEHAELDLNRHTINHVVKVHQTRALLHLSEKQFTKAEAEWKSIQDLYEKTSFRKLAPLAQVITSVGDELFDERDWDGAEWCFSKASSIAGCGWYSHYRLGETRMQVDRHAEAFRDFVRSAELSSYARGFASVRNAAYKIEHALRNKGSSEVELAKYRQKRFEFSRKAHELDPLNWKNCADRAEDLRQSGDFREALPILWAARLRLFLTIRHDRHRTIRSWHERRRRDALSRLYWNTGRALDGMNETSEESKAKHKIRAGARLENSESGWRELARIEAGWGMFSHVIEAHEAWLRCIERMDPVRWKELDGAAVRNMLQLAYKAYEKEGKFAEAALADRYYAELYHALGGWSLPSHRIFAAAGDWLLSRRIAGLAFECLLNACRLSPLPAYRRKLAEAAKLKGSGLAEPLYARAIETEYAEPFRRQMEVVLHSLSSRSQPQTEVEQAVLAELLGDAGAIDRYANLARSIVSRDVVNPSEARLVADGLLLANKSEQARTMFRWLSEQLAMPEKYYLVATLCSVQKPLTQ